ncbi:hypothetical protein BAUCODRAFT_145392 [Baudoinia panamericana UAMH 10762]|uniref:General stress protein FMN-binding split barrel domain-containing protein n=1 Tax=Baudoinia panamericana (strain UAMH 10762) TaxID=717646 RepID=M2NKV1_BAUPA|nr:uncharacterized protein BAUCODRAFT_145392 [Baudoinia panamericana UAMH 10762]EMD00080.1 hypothetical protein BAUCODRAFT_145392 [Baudoinia panamericana UAMH 10762]
MPEGLTKQEVDKGIDPSVNKQYDDQTPTEQKFEDMYAIADKLKIGMLGSYRNGIGPVSRAMAVAKRTGPDFLFLANRNSQKFDDLNKNKEAQVIFHNTSTQDWICVTGEATSTSNEDPRIKEVYSKAAGAWFGDLKDGVHTGGPEDPRMTLIEIKAKYISYWKHEVSSLGYMAEVATATMTGGVAATGTLRQMKEDEISQARSKHSTMSS